MLAVGLLAVAVLMPPRDGSRDFDFEIGRWRVHLERLRRPLTHSTEWTSLDGTSVVRPLWNGEANLGELEVDGPDGHVEGMSLRVYDARAHQWRIHWANANDGLLGTAMVGGFANGRGEFYDQEDFNGRAIWVRFIFSDITRTAFRLEQAFSDDGGASWETNWITTFTRDTSASAAAPNAAAGSRVPNDFDFEAGRWTMQERRLTDPLGRAVWTSSEGATHIVDSVWAGRAGIGQLQLRGATPTFAGSLLRTYRPQSRQWSLYWVDRATGRVSAPLVGAFANGQGVFYGQDEVGGVTALVRLRVFDIGATSFRTEQSYSLNGGGQWTPFYLTTFTRRAASTGGHAALDAAAREYDQAQFRNDVATLGRLVADDFVLVNSNASVENKTQFLADFHLPGFKIEPYVVEQPVRTVWATGAVLGGLVRLHWTQDGAQHRRAVRVAYTWALDDGRWQVKYAQVTRVPDDERTR